MGTSTDMSIADKLAEQQQEISVAEFFEQNRQMLGFGSNARSLVTTVKEATDNAIDACEEAGILPTVTITITESSNNNLKITITDNGPGIKKEQIPKIFGKLLYGSRFSSRVQARGQQGIGISAAVLYAQQSTGKPAEITSKTEENDSAEHYKLRINTDTNEPKIAESSTATWEHQSDHGTSITVYIDGNFRARSRLHDYIKYTAIVNPHVTIHFSEPEHEFHSERTVETLPKKPKEIKPHPHGTDLGTLRKMLGKTDSHSVSGFLQSEFTRVGQSTADEIIGEFKDRINGRHIRWTVPAPETEHTHTNGVDGQSTLPGSKDTPDTVTLESHIAAHVNRKTRDVTNAYANALSSELYNNTPVSWVEVKETVESVADTIESDFNATIGETVREKTADAAWSVITTTRHQTLENTITNATSKKKTQEDIKTLSKHVEDVLSNDGKNTYDSYTKTELGSIIDEAATKAKSDLENSFGETAKSNIINSIWRQMDVDPGDPPLIREIMEDRDLIEKLLKSMQAVSVMAPPSHCLSPIGETDLEQGIRKVYDAEFYSTVQRGAKAYSGEPFVVEAGIAHGGNIESDGSIQLLRFANRVPLVYKQGACTITKVVSKIRWNNYKLSDKGNGLPQGPVAIVVHIASTNVPFTSESKDAVASVSIIEDEIERAVRDVARDLKRHLKKQKTLKKQRRKQDKIDEILPEIASKVSHITGNAKPNTAKSTAKIMNNVFIDVETNDDHTNVHVRNYNDRKSFTGELQFEFGETPSELPEGATTRDNETKIVVDIDVEPGGDTVIDFPGVGSVKHVDHNGIEEESVSVSV